MSKRDAISQSLRAEIASGTYDASGKLPSEAQLVDRFGVSRPTIARALRDLHPGTNHPTTNAELGP